MAQWHRKTRNCARSIAALALTPLAALALAQAPASSRDEVLVLGRWDNPFGFTSSASQGVVGAAELDARPRMRSSEVLEAVPGLIVTQHSGTGKSNQMFLRGFNLDHGTDFATWVDGMPVNLPTHGHGQGYTDLNFLIPELVERLEYRKGPYYAEVSDFSSAGAAYLTTYERLPEGIVKGGLGEDGYVSVLVADSVGAGNGDLLYAAQAHRYDGPWVDISEDLRRDNVQLRYSSRTDNASWNMTLMGYDAEWNSADQIPRRAVESGALSRLGSVDTTLGGETSRYSLSGAWGGGVGAGRAHASAYVVDYDLSLFSNFTYLLDDPVNGDQFAQVDDRTVKGGEFTYVLGEESRLRHTFGATLRNDDIGEVGVNHAAARERLATVRSDSVDELSFGAYYSADVRLTDRLRATLGARADHFDFDVASDRPENSGAASETSFAPKADLIYSVGKSTELYLSAGKGFHSNDARGTTITIDPATGEPAEPVTPLVGSVGYELGFRSFVERKLNVSAALWLLDLDSELVFVGDAGNTEASRPSRRYGIEVPVYWRPSDRLAFDVELALTDSKFTDFDAAGDEIPGSIDEVVAAGVTLQNAQGFYGSARLRYFGERPLIEDGSVESAPSTVVNLSFGFKRPSYDVRVDVLNTFDSDDDDITYWYASRLPGEPAEGVEDYHFHPLEPRNVRVYLSFKF